MIYGKLPVVFLSVMATEKKGSTNSVIASYILEHMEDMKDLGIKELAARCHVGLGSVSRFCREIGLQDFVELKELLWSAEMNYQVCSGQETAYDRAKDYGDRVKSAIDMVTSTLSLQLVGELCRDFIRYEKAAVFGLLKAEGAAVNLQTDLLMLGRQVYTNMSYNQQIGYIRQAGRGDLIVIFSCTGSYFEYEREALFGGRDKGDWPKIWVVSGMRRDFPGYVAKVLYYRSLGDQASHPYQLQYIASIIAQEYAVLTGQ